MPPNTRALFSYWLVDNNNKNLMKLRKVNGGDKRSVSVCETCCKFPRIHIYAASLYVPATNLVFQFRTGSEETSMNCSCYIIMKKSIANKKESCHFLSYLTMVERPKILSGR